jgi:hypothetical protein
MTREKDQAHDIADLSNRMEKESQRIWLKFTDLASAAESGGTAITKIQQQAGAQELLPATTKRDRDPPSTELGTGPEEDTLGQSEEDLARVNVLLILVR